MEINGVSTKEMTHADAIELIKQCGSNVTLLVRRGGKLPPHLGEYNTAFVANFSKLVNEDKKYLTELT